MYLLLGAAYNLIVPPFENLDEIEHFGAVRYIAETGRLPVHGAPAEAVYHYRQEASQPPLYHLLSAGLVRLLGLRADEEDILRFNPRVACGPNAPFLYDNRAILYHNPWREHSPAQGTFLMLRVLRLWSTLLQALTVAGTYALARRTFPAHPGVSLLATAIVAFNPQFLFVASGVNNDNLVTPLAVWGLYLLLHIAEEGPSAPRLLTLGVLTGLAGLSKLSGWLLLPFASLVLIVQVLRSRPRRWLLQTIFHIGLLAIPAAVVSGWWFWRNWCLYGDPTALAPMLELVGLRGSPIYPWNEAGLVFRSFWGQIPCSFYPAGFYIPYLFLTVIGIVGLLLGWQYLTGPARRRVVYLAVWFVLVLLGWLRWNMTTPAPGGRLLFPALPAIAILLALGLYALTRLIRPLTTRSQVIPALVIPSLVIRPLVILFALLALWTAADILPAFYAPPPRYADPADVRPQQLVDAHFGDRIRLLGYDFRLDEKDRSLDVTLYWQPVASIAEDYILALQLVSPVPGDNTLIWTYDSWPGHGNYPTSAWQPGEVIRDRYRFRLPAPDLPTQAWDLQLVMYTPERGRLPAFINETPTGDRIVLHRVRIQGHEPACPESSRLTAEVRLAGSVLLTHATVVTDTGEAEVTLCWKSIAPLDDDYQVFVHLYDRSGNLLAAGDGPPMGGAFPSSLWQPGDIVRDMHRLPWSPEGERIAVGMYRLSDGVRLPVTIGDTTVPDAAIPIWPERP